MRPMFYTFVNFIVGKKIVELKNQLYVSQPQQGFVKGHRECEPGIYSHALLVIQEESIDQRNRGRAESSLKQTLKMMLTFLTPPMPVQWGQTGTHVCTQLNTCIYY